MSYITLAIIAVTGLVSYKGFNNADFRSRFILHPYTIAREKNYWTLITSTALHADWTHLLFNMITLYFFGRNLETHYVISHGILGHVIFALFYVIAGVIASIPSTLKHKDNYGYAALGASGAVSAVLFGVMLLYPFDKIYLFFIPIGIPSFVFAPLYLIYSVYMDRRGGDNIGHNAHYSGAVFGIIFVLITQFEAVKASFFNLLAYLG